MEPITDAIPPNTLSKLRQLMAQQEALQTRLDELLTAVADAAGHDLARLELRALDLAAGTYTLGPRGTTPNGGAVSSDRTQGMR